MRLNVKAVLTWLAVVGVVAVCAAYLLLGVCNNPVYGQATNPASHSCMYTYEQGCTTALNSGKPLVIGVGCAAPVDPQGTRWVSACTKYLAGYPSPCVVVCYPSGGYLYYQVTLHPTANTAVVAHMVANCPAPVPSNATPVAAQAQPAYQPQYQYQPQYMPAPTFYRGGFGGGGGGC